MMEAFDDDLYNASAWGEFEKVRSILDSRTYGLNSRNSDGKTPLFIACSYGFQNEFHNHFGIAQLLIERGADVNLANNLGQTPLYMAACWGRWNIVALLIENGADLDVMVNEGRTALHIAAFSVPHLSEGNKKYGNYFRNNKHHSYHLAKTYMERVMMEAQGYLEFLPKVTQHYETLSSSPIDPREDIPDNIMDIIVYYNHFATVVELVKAGAELELKDANGDTALARAAFCGHLAMVKFLVNQGADVDAVNNFHQSVMDLAAVYKNTRVVDFLDEMQEHVD